MVREGRRTTRGLDRLWPVTGRRFSRGKGMEGGQTSSLAESDRASGELQRSLMRVGGVEMRIDPCEVRQRRFVAIVARESRFELQTRAGNISAQPVTFRQPEVPLCIAGILRQTASEEEFGAHEISSVQVRARQRIE
jgi:hypothetical protein